MYANIIPLTKLPLNKQSYYTYDCGELTEQLCVGQLVNIPFHHRTISGIIIDLIKQAPPNINYKKISAIIEEQPVINKFDLEVAELTSKYYHVSLGLLLKQNLPQPLKRKSKKIIAKLEEIDTPVFKKSESTIINQKPILINNTLAKRQDYYFQTIERTLAAQQQVLFLVPEIMLIPQTIQWLEKSFPEEKIILLHSSLSKTKRWVNWRLAQTGHASIFVGTRGTIFSSFHDLGIIILDEEHDLSYKQWDMNPRYDARRVSEYKSRLYNSQLIFGTTAPSVSSYFKMQKEYYATEGEVAPLRLQTEGEVRGEVINMRDELHKGNYSIFSEKLEQTIKEVINNQGQIILFVNRRGASTFVMCRDCGHVMRCPNCKKALVEYKNKTLSCTTCSLKMSSPNICPKCNSPKIKGFGLGIEKVEQRVKDIFPETNLIRLDSVANLKDATKKYQDFAENKASIIIGTQIALRLTSLNLKLIAALNIDSILNFPDWRTDEKAWQILQQITNRDDQAESLIQTYNPENKLLQLLKDSQDNLFYEQELDNRQSLNYPPFAKMIKLICKSDDYDFLLKEVDRVINELRKRSNDTSPSIKIIGPITPINEKVRYFWQRHIILKLDSSQYISLTKDKKNDTLNEVLINLSNSWSIDVDPLT